MKGVPGQPCPLNAVSVTSSVSASNPGLLTPSLPPSTQKTQGVSGVSLKSTSLEISGKTSHGPLTKPLTNLERLVSHILEHGQQFGSGHCLTVNLPVRTTVGTIIPSVFDRFNLDTEHGLVWVHSSTARTTYAATEIDAAFWNHRLEVRP